VLSSFDFMSSTPTLFNSARAARSSRAATSPRSRTNLDGIYEAIKENAMLQKYAGGIGNDWTPVRALGAHIKGTNGKSQGVVPFLKVVNDTPVAVNQGGKRKGPCARTSRTWHLDVEEFLELAQEHRRRPPPHARHEHGQLGARPLHEARDGERRVDAVLAVGRAGPARQVRQGVREAYLEYEAKCRERRDQAPQEDSAAAALAQDALDAVRDRAPVAHVQGSLQPALAAAATSASCTARTCAPRSRSTPGPTRSRYATSGSVNMPAHLDQPTGRMDMAKLKRTIGTAMRMLDNVIDLNFYNVRQGAQLELQAPPVGLGHHGLPGLPAHAAHPYGSPAGVEFADRSMEQIAYSRVLGLDRYRRGARDHTPRSGLAVGPRDTAGRHAEARRRGAGRLRRVRHVDDARLGALRKRIHRPACAIPTASRSRPPPRSRTSPGLAQSIEPTYQNLYVKSNLSGEFTVVNEFLVRDLKELNLWDEVMIADLKYFDGSLAKIDRIPAEVRALYATSFEIEPKWLVECAARRQKWIDQSQSLNIYMAGASGKKLDETYKLAWLRGLKTTYYLRTMGATHAEKSTVTTSQLNAVPAGDYSAPATDAKFCSIDNPECESCQ
jgi:ribonucleoside-diphosphate reductase alpha chain